MRRRPIASTSEMYYSSYVNVHVFAPTTESIMLINNHGMSVHSADVPLSNKQTYVTLVISVIVLHVQ